ncbi:hypothetical protein ABK040_010738 [Willaertia magna]
MEANQTQQQQQPPRVSNPNNRVFVSNLPYRTSWTSLKQHFSQVGNVTYARIFMDQNTKKSKGMGYVEFENQEDAEKAIQQFNESEYYNRKIFVRKFQEKERTPQQ